MSKLFSYLIAGFVSLSSCHSSSENSSSEEETIQEMVVKSDSTFVQPEPVKTKLLMEIIDTCNLRVYIPDYSRIDLVCGKMPEKNNSSIIYMASAAYTVKCLSQFDHSNIVLWGKGRLCSDTHIDRSGSLFCDPLSIS